MNRCKNCEHPIEAADKFCSHCGQSNKSFERPVLDVGKNMFHELLDIDGRLVLTIKALLLKPGLLTLEYNQGKRQKYTPPLRMYLVMSIVFFLVFSLVERSLFPSRGGLDSMATYYPKIIFVLLPAFAGLLQLLYRKTYYIANLIFAIHIHTFSYFVFIFMFPLESLEEHFAFVSLVIQLPLFAYFSAYLLMALKLNYQQSWPWTVTKFFSLSLSYLAIMMVSFEVVQRWLMA